MKDYFTLFADPSAIFLGYEAPERRENMRLISGDVTTVVDLGANFAVTKKGYENPIVLRKVRIHGIAERHGAFWTAAGPEDDARTLDGWVSRCAFADDVDFDVILWEGS